ncbi:MAG: alcohol dehydrogenase [Nitratiruptor sp.]|nr:alcohol dehydrogenase [Nitratiruptor sp.]NPA83657.1 SDR family NAD(P)-dependent oxidoreductase [Campylobacterota bacterium]
MGIFITGIGSGLGKALAKEYVDAGKEVYALGRHLPPELQDRPNCHFVSIDLAAHERIPEALEMVFGERDEVDLAILNAGRLGPIRDMDEVSLREIESVMDLNVWANKVILDWFKKRLNVRQIVAISSGASVSGARGWNGYAISKAALNMLIKLYAAEMPQSHLSALAPGLIDTPMMEWILTHADPERFPVVKRLANSPRHSPEEGARLLIDIFPRLLEYPSGSYLDVRSLD